MGSIKLVINISDDDFKIIRRNVAVHNPLCPIGQEEMVQMIANGVPVPKNSIFEAKRVGKWLWKQTGYNIINGPVGDWYCSTCKRTIDKNVPVNYISHVLPYNYCPLCGSKNEEIDFAPNPYNNKGDNDD